MVKIIIYTDGASRGNPGRASYGFCIKDTDGKILYTEGKYIGIATNNFAEYAAVINALKYAERKFKRAQIIFFMDSKLVVEQLSGRFKIKSANLKPLIYQIKEMELHFEKVDYNHIPRTQNTTADALANKALDSLK